MQTVKVVKQFNLENSKDLLCNSREKKFKKFRLQEVTNRI